jgi:CheY-like chemotaxis protein
VDGSLARSRGGLGLGLALVKGLVELHGGTVEAASEGRGRGTEITLRLPLVERSPEESGPVGSSQNTGGGQRILVIEDNRDAAETLGMFLQIFGHEVALAFNGPEGVAAARTFFPTVVLCDLGLPGGMDGFAVARALRQEPGLEAAYLIALTGYGKDEDRRRSQEAGFDRHLVKPVEVDALQAVLANLERPAKR